MVTKKNIKECTDYVSKYFFPLKSGGHLYLENNKFIFYDDKNVKSIFFKRMPIDVNKWYFENNLTLYNTISHINKPRIEGTNINMCEGLLHKNYKKYSEYSKEVKEGVDLLLSYIKEVICSFQDTSYEYLLKWISNVCKGNKNDSIIYMKSLEGVGKSTIWEFITDNVLGKKICIKSNADPLKTPYNKILLGMLFVVFEELPTFSVSEWNAISSKLKDLTTSKTCIYSDKFEKQFEAENISNYVINTNVDAIKDSHGRRIFMPPISTKRINDHVYFGNIRNKCFNNNIGEAFYSYMMEINTENFNAQKDMPETRNKLNAIASRLDSIYLFLKENYILKRKGIKAKTSILYSQYKQYCLMNERKPIGKHEFFNKLHEINIDYKKTDGFHKFIVQYSELQEIANKFKWIHETDEYTESHDLSDINDFENGDAGFIDPLYNAKWYQDMIKKF